jgi:hypothetical protein
MLNVNSACSTRCMSDGIAVYTQVVRGYDEAFLSPHKFHKIQNSSGCNEVINKILEFCILYNFGNLHIRKKSPPKLYLQASHSNADVHIIRGGFAVKLRKLKLQGRSLARAPSKAVGGIVMCSHDHIFLKKLSKVRRFNHFVVIPFLILNKHSL